MPMPLAPCIPKTKVNKSTWRKRASNYFGALFVFGRIETHFTHKNPIFAQI